MAKTKKLQPQTKPTSFLTANKLRFYFEFFHMVTFQIVAWAPPYQPPGYFLAIKHLLSGPWRKSLLTLTQPSYWTHLSPVFFWWCLLTRGFSLFSLNVYKTMNKEHHLIKHSLSKWGREVLLLGFWQRSKLLSPADCEAEPGNSENVESPFLGLQWCVLDSGQTGRMTHVVKAAASGRKL